MGSSDSLALAASLLLLLAQQALGSPTSSPDFLAMSELGAKLEAANPTAFPTWQSGYGPCSGTWKGVIECDPESMRVVHLDLSNQRLRGPIPGAELAALTALTYLDLGNNSFDGSIPEALYTMAQLTYLNLEKNELTGSVPESIHPLRSLAHLKLTGNSLSGPLPASLGMLAKLQSLELGYNKFNGTIPPSLGSLKNLTILRLSANLLSGAIPASLSLLSRITVLELFSNKLTGGIPIELGNAKALVSISLDDNRLTGSLPESLGNLLWLSAFYATSNNLSGEIPASFANLHHLTFLDLSDNPRLGGVLPSFLGKLRKLQSLALVKCSFEAAIPPELGLLPQLQELYLDRNRLQGAIPPSLGALPALERLYLAHNGLQRQIPPTFCHMARAREIDLSGNALEGPIPACLAGLGDLTLLNLAQNNLTGPLLNTSSRPQLVVSYDENCLAGAANQLPSCAQQAVPPSPPPAAAAAAAPAPTLAWPAATSRRRRGSSTGLVVLLSLLATVAAVGGILAVLYMHRSECSFLWGSSSRGSGGGASAARGRRKEKRASKAGLREFSLAAVKRATKNFTTEIGKGSFGAVYVAEGLLGADCGTLLALKRAANVSKHSDFMFKCKVELLSRARHPNVVNLVGFCVGSGEQVLAYEYIPGCTLHDKLHKQAEPILSWDERVRIAAEVAVALSHLHHGCSPALIHRNISSSNIFLTDTGSAKLADFGLKKSHSEVDRSTGYLDPQCEHMAMLTEKSDVYAFGVVLLELITGQKAMKDVTLAHVAAPFLADTQMLPLMVDSKLELVDPSELHALGEIARDCIGPERAERPSMRDVVAHMEERNVLPGPLLAEGAGGAAAAAPAQDDLLLSLLPEGAARGSLWAGGGGAGAAGWAAPPGRDPEDPLRSSSQRQRERRIASLLAHHGLRR